MTISPAGINDHCFAIVEVFELKIVGRATERPPRPPKSFSPSPKKHEEART